MRGAQKLLLLYPTGASPSTALPCWRDKTLEVCLLHIVGIRCRNTESKKPTNKSHSTVISAVGVQQNFRAPPTRSSTPHPNMTSKTFLSATRPNNSMRSSPKTNVLPVKLPYQPVVPHLRGSTSQNSLAKQLRTLP